MGARLGENRYGQEATRKGPHAGHHLDGQAARLHLSQSAKSTAASTAFWDYGPLGVELKRNVKRRLVAMHDAGARRRRRAGRLDPHAPRRLGGLAATRSGFTDPLVDCKHLQEPLPRRPASSSMLSRGSREGCRQLRRACGGELTEPRAFNLMFKTFVGPVEDEAGRRLPAPRNRPGHLRQLRATSQTAIAQEAALRHRADRQGLPQRDQPAQLHLPLARVRADGDGVLRPARHRRSSGTSTGRTSASTGIRPRHESARISPGTSTAKMSSPTTPSAATISSTSSPSAARSWRASPTAPTTT